MEVEGKPSGNPEPGAKRKPRLGRLTKKAAIWTAAAFIGAVIAALATRLVDTLFT